MISLKKNYDAIVVGGGPAGSSTAALLAEKGHDVLVVEKEKFPRYHVGESLMPFCYFPLLQKLELALHPQNYFFYSLLQKGVLHYFQKKYY